MFGSTMPQIGVQAVITGMNPFINNSNIFNQNILKMTQSVRAAQTAPQALGSAFSGLSNILSRTVSVMGGILGAQLFNKIGAVIGSIVEEAFNATSVFQRLTIQFEGLIAREMRIVDTTLSVADSFKAAVAPAHELLDWVKLLAVQSPFTVEDITNTTALAMSYGFTTQQTKGLTDAIVNFSSGMGLTSLNMQRIIINFGQIAAAGKVMGTELRDLARGAFVPVNQLLRDMAETAGVTFGQMKEAATSGKVPVEAFFQAFINMANRDFPNAAERMSRTWQGVTSNIRDFVQTFLGVEVLGPIVQRFVDKGADVLKQLITPEARDQFTEFGQFIDSALGPIVDSMFAWGDAFAQNFAAGIFHGAIAILDALNYIGELVTFWLSPGSPPRLLPDLPDWGESAVNEWMSGWKKADFSVFDDLSKTIENFLKSLGTGIIPAVDLIPRILGTDAAIAEAVAQFKLIGTVTQEALDKIASAMGFADQDINDFVIAVFKGAAALEAFNTAQDKTDLITKLNANNFADQRDQIALLFSGTDELSLGVQEYVKTLESLAIANEDVVRVQDELNDLTDQYTSSLRPLNAQLQIINDRQQDIKDTTELASIERQLANTHLTAKKREQLELQKAELLIRRQIRTTEAERDLAINAKQDELDAAKKTQGGLSDIAQEQHDNVLMIAKTQEAAAKVISDAAQAQLDAMKGLLEHRTAENKLIEDQVALLERLAKAAAAAAKAGGAGEPNVIGGFGIDLGAESVKRGKEKEEKPQGVSILDLIRSKVAEVQATWSRAFGAMMVTLKPLTDGLGDLGIAFDELEASVAMDMPLIGDHFAKAIAFMTEAGAIVGPDILANMTGIVNDIKDIWIEFGPDILNIISGAWNLAVTGFLNFWVVITAIFHIFTTMLLGALRAVSAIWRGDWAAWWTNAKDTFSGYKDIILGAIGTMWGNMLHLFGTSSDEFRVKWNAFWSGLWTKLVEWTTKLLQPIIDLGTKIANWLVEDFAPRFRQGWIAFWTEITDSWKEIFRLWKLLVEKLPAWWTAWLADFKLTFSLKWKGFWNEIISSWQGIWDAWKLIIGAFPAWISALFTGWLTTFTNNGKALAQGLMDGITGVLGGLGDRLISAIAEAIRKAKEFFGIKSPSIYASMKLGRPLGEGVAYGFEKALKDLRPRIRVSVADLIPNASNMLAASQSYNYSNTHNYNLSVNSNRSSQGLQQDFSILESLG